ncbi:uncharacterized protein LOC111389690 [Olea europaea subsp. europaea]|uniref:Uncharacterized protein LOC111389690, partial n=1 Tax=Olea europaea subsp. europaea TaxID=158383 RepID=A0A8S0UPG7_OLEEU|nr:uncharacterized protein LOC111389690 [Olea europaea subsp. europaea]
MVETRRSSSSSKRALSSPSSSLPNGKKSKAAEASSSSTNDSPAVDEVVSEAVAKESARDEVRSVDLANGDGAKQSDVEKSPEATVEVDVGASVTDTEKAKLNGPAGNRGKKGQLKSHAGDAWGKLLSQSSQNPHVVLHHPTFTVGQGSQCDLWVGDPSVGKSLCNLKHMESEGGESITLLEITGKKGSVQVNGKSCTKDSTVQLKGGDEVVFSSSDKHAYVFQQLVNNKASVSDVPPVNILEAHGGPIKGLHIDARSGDPSTVAVASTLASLSNPRKELSFRPSSSPNDEDAQQGSELPSGPAACEVLDNGVLDADMKDSSDNNDEPIVSLGEKTTIPSPCAANENLNIDAETGKIVSETSDLRPFLRILAGSTAPELDINFSISKIINEHMGVRDRHKDSDPPISVSSRRQAFRDGLQEGILDSKYIDVSFENFPYYLSETTKHVLIASAYIPLKSNKFAKFTSDLSTVCPRILLSGPAGSEIYQETLTKALAKHTGARLLIVDSILLPGGPTMKEADPVKETSKPERASVFAKRAAAAALHLKKPTSSVEADITGGSAVSSQAQPKQEASTASSKNYAFKKGDRVKYVGSLPSGFSPQTPIR